MQPAAAIATRQTDLLGQVSIDRKQEVEEAWIAYNGHAHCLALLRCLAMTKETDNPLGALLVKLPEGDFSFPPTNPIRWARQRLDLRDQAETDKDGNTRYTTEVIAQRIQLLGKPERPAGDPPTLEEPPADQEPDVPDNDIPF